MRKQRRKSQDGGRVPESNETWRRPPCALARAEGFPLDYRKATMHPLRRCCPSPTAASRCPSQAQAGDRATLATSGSSILVTLNALSTAYAGKPQTRRDTEPCTVDVFTEPCTVDVFTEPCTVDVLMCLVPMALGRVSPRRLSVVIEEPIIRRDNLGGRRLARHRGRRRAHRRRAAALMRSGGRRRSRRCAASTGADRTLCCS
jgi:hypothetical protein